MKRLAWSAAVLLIAASGCENGNPRLAPVTSNRGANAAKPAAAPAAEADHTGTVEERLARLENNYAKYAEPLEFLGQVYAKQKQQQVAQEREEPAPDAVFAVDIAPDVAAGQVEGPNSAMVTIVEAWDFA